MLLSLRHALFGKQSFFEHVHVVDFDKLHTALQMFYNIKTTQQNEYLYVWSEGSGSPQVFVYSSNYSPFYFLLNVMIFAVVLAP